MLEPFFVSDLPVKTLEVRKNTNGRRHCMLEPGWCNPLLGLGVLQAQHFLVLGSTIRVDNVG